MRKGRDYPLFLPLGEHYWRVVDDLDRVAGRVETVKAAGAITVGTGRGLHFHIMATQEIEPDIDLLGLIDNKTDVVEPLVTGEVISARGAVQGQIVIAGGEIDIVGVGPPLDLHPHQIDVEVLASLEVGNEQCDVAQAGGRLWLKHRPPPPHGSRNRD